MGQKIVKEAAAKKASLKQVNKAKAPTMDRHEEDDANFGKCIVFQKRDLLLLCGVKAAGDG